LVLTVCLAGYYTWSVADGYTSGGATVTDAVETIDIRWTSGSVTVGYHDADTVILEEEAVRPIEGNDRLRWKLDGKTLVVEYNTPGFLDFLNFTKPSKALTVTLPKGIALKKADIIATSADIVVPELTAEEITIGSTSGDVKAEVTAPVVYGESTSGDVILKVNGKADSTLRRYLWPTTISNQEEEENFYSGTPDDPYTERTLKQGMYGKDVANMQMRLKSAGYLLGNADGIFGPVTKAAVLALQKDNNLKQDGIVGGQTWAYIKTLAVSNAEPTVVDTSKPSVGAYTTKLRKGSSGTQVKKLQQQLIQLGYLPAGEDDGKYGSKTAYAVMQFQLDHHISVDGVAGPQTFVRLNEELGVQWDVPVG